MSSQSVAPNNSVARELNLEEAVAQHRDTYDQIRSELGRSIIGMDDVGI